MDRVDTDSTATGGLPARTSARSPVERLLRRARPDRARRLSDRELRVEIVVAAIFLAVAVAMPLFWGSHREFDPLLAAALVFSHALAARIRVFVGAGAAMPTQLIIVPMLFLMPVTVVPALVAGGLLLAAGIDVVRGRAHAERLVTATGDAWHAVGSSVVLALAGEPDLVASSWPLIAGALVAQCSADLFTATAREWLGRGIAPVLQLRVIGSVHLIDACLTPVGLMAAWAGAHHRLGFAVVLPLLALLGAFASDRRARIEEVGRRLDDLRDERRRLDEAIRRIGDAFASKLDRVALVDLALNTAVDALGAQHGRAWLAGGTIDAGEADDGADGVLAAAAAAAREDRRPRSVRDRDHFVMAWPLSSCQDRQATEVLAVARRGRTFSEAERGLFGHLVAQARIAIENVELHEQLRMQATTDDLTGLANHRRFQETLSEETSRARRVGRPVGLVMFDVDNFKSVNDVHGHQQGDAVLKAVAKAVAGSARSTDKPARYGGEELAVVLPDTDLDGAVVAAEAMRRAVESLVIPLPGGSSLKVSVSAGVSAMRPEFHDPGQLVAAADEALYEAKRQGKNRTVRGRRPESRFLSGAGLEQPQRTSARSGAA
jgi:diguanylate cyclase (GGDEF)-like protein